ncbi:hypothetical protein KIF59_10010 [Enterobacter cloacae subsp. cloacae]|nr:hypothetical protein [Enterobacter cloacae subsp. cloacae]
MEELKNGSYTLQRINRDGVSSLSFSSVKDLRHSEGIESGRSDTCKNRGVKPTRSHAAPKALTSYRAGERSGKFDALSRSAQN